MSPLRRAAAVLTSVGLLALLPALPRNAALAREDPDPAKPSADDKESKDRFHPAADARLAAKLDAAHDYLHNADWDRAVLALQQLLDLNDDRMVEVDSGKDSRLVSARAEAGRLIAALPADGKKAYRAAHGPAAADLLKEGVKEKDEKKIAEVVRRFLNTDAGPGALEALAVLHYDAGRYRLAALSYARLLGLRDAARWAPEMLFHAWDAFRRTGDKDHADLVGTQLLKGVGGEGVRIGDKKFSRDDLEKEMSKPLVEANGDWPMFGGDAGRSARGEGGMPFLHMNWAAPTTVSNVMSLDSAAFGAKAAVLFKAAADRLAQVNQPLLPPQFPVTTSMTLKRDGKPHSVVVFRTHSGIVACDMASGKLVGRNPIKGSLDWMTSEAARENALNEWMQQYNRPDERPGILFANTVIGTLSSDGDFVYTVEDLAAPPPASFSVKRGFPANPNPWGWPRDILEAVYHNRLMAYDVAAGCKTVWELPGLDNDESELEDSYFRGPPLPLDGRLFVLNEKGSELRLIGLETAQAKKGNRNALLSFVLPLGTMPTGLRDDPWRRVHASLLAYGDGVLVCPTNAGYVVGVDLLTHTLAWVHRYEEPKAASAPPGGRILPPGFVPPVGLPVAPSPGGWCNPAPIVSGGAVIVAPPDSDSLSCLDLKTGDLRWKDARQDGGLYVAGVFDGRVLVVGKKACRAYNLSDGKLLWTLNVGVPSGQGAAAGGVYYLPLGEAAASHEPEICAIDLAKGKVVGHGPVRGAQDKKAGALGNLLFCDGALVSQTLSEVAAYPLLKTKLEQMDAALAKNPNDPDGLFSRAELRLENGDLLAAVEDLRKVIDAKPPQELLGKARAALYDGLNQLLQSDFDKGEKYLKEYEELCKTGANDAAARSRRAGFFMLIGRGYEGQGRPLETLKAYEELGGFGDDALPAPDDPALQVCPAVWANAHIADLLRKATPEQRKQIQEEIDRRFKDAKESADVGDLRAFIALFGPSTAAGRAARLERAERLIAKEGGDREAEVLLTGLARQKDDAGTAARAVEALARLSVRLGLLEDAVYYYGLLNREYATTKIREDKTGADFYKDMIADKRFLPYLGNRPTPFEGGLLRAKDEFADFTPKTAVFHFAHHGEPLPFFRGSKLDLQFDKHELMLVDRATGEPRWKPIPLTQTMFQNILEAGAAEGPPAFPGKPVVNTQRPPAPEFSYQSLGRLAVVPVGHMVFGVDAVAGKVLWEKDLNRPADRPVAGPPIYLSASFDPRDGDALVIYQDGWVQRLGPGAMVLTPSALCMMTRDGLTAFDPLTARTLWRRDDMAADCRIFGDDSVLFVVESAQGAPARTRAFRADDGSPVEAPDFRAAFEKRLRIVGRNLLTADTGKDGLTIRLYDPLTGKDLWTETYPAQSIALDSLAADLAGAVDPKGNIHIVDLNSRKEIMGAAVDPKYLDGVASVSLLTDGKNFYVACDAALPANTLVKSNLAPGTGLRDLPINGEFFAFDAATGKMRWHVPARRQRLLLDGFADLPLVAFAAQQAKVQAPLGGALTQNTAVFVVEKRSGKLVYDADNFMGGSFHELDVDPAKGRIEFVSPKAKITIAMMEK